MDSLEIGVKLNDSGAKKGLDGITDSIGKLEGATKKAGKQTKKNTDTNKKATKGMSSLAGAVKGAVGAYLGFRGVSIVMRNMIRLGNESLELFKQQEISTRRLETIAKNVAGANETQIQSLKDLSDALQLTTTYGNEVYESGLSQILSFGTTTEQAKMLSGSLGDLMAAQYGATASTQDAISSANMLGKALNGQSGALSRAGILMNDHQKMLLKEGDMATRVSAIIEIMADNYGGLAEELANTDTGGLQQKQNTIDDLKELIGNDLLPVYDDWKAIQIEIFKYIVDNKGAIVKSFRTILGAVSKVVNYMSEVTKGFRIQSMEQAIMDADALAVKYGELETARNDWLHFHKNASADSDTYRDFQRRIKLLKEEEKALRAKAEALKESVYPTAPPTITDTDVSLVDNSQKSRSRKTLTSDCDADCQKKRLAQISKEKQAIWKKQIEEDEAYRKLILDGIAKRRADEEEARLEEYNSRPLVMIFGDTPASIISQIYSFAQEIEGATMSILGSIFDIKNTQRQNELNALQKQHKDELDSFIGSAQAKKDLIKKQGIEEDKLRQEAFDKKKKQEKANTLLNMASGVAGAWSSAMQLPFPANIIVGTANSALMTGVAIAQLASINAQEFAEGGIVGGNSTRGDRVTAKVNSEEMILNKRQQSRLFSLVDGKGKISGNSLPNIFIENFMGNDEDISRLEDMLYRLNSNGRISDTVFA